MTTPQHFTDLGNAARLVARHGEDLLYCHALGSWLIFDDRRWAPDETGEIMRRAKDTVRAMYADAAELEDDTERKALVKHARDSEAAPRLRAMIDLATSEPGIPVTVGQLDTDPDLFTVTNGTIHLPSGELRPHRREDLITRITPVEYDPDAECPRWLAFLHRITEGNAELTAYLRRLVGYSLTGLTTEQMLALLYGTGANGKSTFLETVRLVAGDYAAQTDTATLMERPNGSIPNDLARLRGARFVSAVETDEGRRLAEGLVKRITGGDTITARFLHREWFEFAPAFTCWLAVNHKPTVRGTDDAIWRRLHLIPFTVTIPEAERDQGLPARLATEAPGILAWAVAGAADWYAFGLDAPDDVRQATRNYRAESDTLGAFLTERCEHSDEATITKADLYRAYVEWSDTNGERHAGQRTFSRRLSERGYDEYQQTNGTRDRCWVGITLATPTTNGHTSKANGTVPNTTSRVSS